MLQSGCSLWVTSSTSDQLCSHICTAFHLPLVPHPDANFQSTHAAKQAVLLKANMTCAEPVMIFALSGFGLKVMVRHK